MKKHLQRLLVFLTVFALVFSFTSCDGVDSLNGFMNSLFGQESEEADFYNPPSVSPRPSEGKTDSVNSDTSEKGSETDAPSEPIVSPAEGEFEIHFLDKFHAFF